MTLPEMAGTTRRTTLIVLGLVASGCVLAGLVVHQFWVADLEFKLEALVLKVAKLEADVVKLRAAQAEAAKERELLKNELRRIRPDKLPEGTPRPDIRPPGRDH